MTDLFVKPREDLEGQKMPWWIGLEDSPTESGFIPADIHPLAVVSQDDNGYLQLIFRGRNVTAYSIDFDFVKLQKSPAKLKGEN